MILSPDASIFGLLRSTRSTQGGPISILRPLSFGQVGVAEGASSVTNQKSHVSTDVLCHQRGKVLISYCSTTVQYSDGPEFV